MTRIYKDARNGWAAETDLPLDNGRVLKILTMKRHNGQISTSAQAVAITEHGFSFVMYQDFHRHSIAHSMDRCTEKNVAAQHRGVIDTAQHLVAAANNFYQAEA